MFSVLATLVSSISAIFLVANSVSLFSSAPQTLELKPNLVARASRLSYLFLALISFRFYYQRRNERPLAATKKQCMGAAKIGPDLRSALYWSHFIGYHERYQNLVKAIWLWTITFHSKYIAVSYCLHQKDVSNIPSIRWYFWLEKRLIDHHGIFHWKRGSGGCLLGDSELNKWRLQLSENEISRNSRISD